jgi:hypothetical protein
VDGFSAALAILRALVLSLLMLGLVGCARPSSSINPPPLQSSDDATWQYAAYLLTQGHTQDARGYLEGVEKDSVSDPALFLRDLAEARLFSGDASGAADAAALARAALAQKPTTAQFRDDDRYIFERTLEALQAAGADDRQRLTRLTQDEQRAPSADAWYCLGWLDEQHQDLAGAKAAYRAFLDRAPQWSFLRQATSMREHARAVIG